MDEQSQKRKDAFISDLNELLNKHQVELEVIDRYDSASLDANFLSSMDPVSHQPISQYFVHNLGSYIYPEK